MLRAKCSKVPTHGTHMQIKEEETLLTQQALREGCSPKDMHRLLLGVSFTNWWVQARPYMSFAALRVPHHARACPLRLFVSLTMAVHVLCGSLCPSPTCACPLQPFMSFTDVCVCCPAAR